MSNPDVLKPYTYLSVLNIGHYRKLTFLKRAKQFYYVKALFLTTTKTGIKRAPERAPKRAPFATSDITLSYAVVLSLQCLPTASSFGFGCRATRQISPGSSDFWATCLRLWDTLDYCPAPSLSPRKEFLAIWKPEFLNSCRRRNIPDSRHGALLPDRVGGHHLVEREPIECEPIPS